MDENTKTGLTMSNNELATKNDVLLIKKEIALFRKELKKEIGFVRRDIIIIALLIILAMYLPEILNLILMFK